MNLVSERFAIADNTEATFTASGNLVMACRGGRSMSLSPMEVFFVSAFGEGRRVRDVCDDLSLTYSSELETFVIAMCDGGLLLRLTSETLGGSDPRNEQSRKMFASNAAAWSERAYGTSPSNYFTRQRLRHAVEWIQAVSGKNASILDLGCGPGQLLVEAAQLGCRAHGVDSSSAMLDVLNSSMSTLDDATKDRISFEAGNVQDIPEGSFDVVAALGVLAWFDNPVVVFDAAARAAKPEGYFIVDCASKLVERGKVQWLTNPSLLRRFGHLPPATLVSVGTDDSRRSGFADLLAESAAALRTSSSQGANEHESEKDEKPDLERRFSWSDFLSMAESAGFDVINVAGVGDVHMAWDQALPPYISGTMKRLLDSFSFLPTSLLWSTGFIALLRKRRVIGGAQTAEASQM